MGADEEHLTLVNGTEGGGTKAQQDLEVSWTWVNEGEGGVAPIPSGEKECEVDQAEMACGHPDTQQVAM